MAKSEKMFVLGMDGMDPRLTNNTGISTNYTGRNAVNNR